MIELPTAKVKALYKSPRKLLIYSPPKCGKTTAASFLEDSLLIDLEEGSDFLDVTKVTVKSISQIREVVKALKTPGAPKYRVGIIDTTTKLEEMVLPYAGDLYRESPMGKNWGKLPNGQVDPTANVLTLPNGAGYLYLREAYTKVSAVLESCFERIIYFGHLKDKMLEKAGKEVSAKDIDLTGKIRNIACANADAIGYMYREENKTIISFKTSHEVICGARPEHLRDKEIAILEYNDGKFTHNWDQIYID